MYVFAFKTQTNSWAFIVGVFCSINIHPFKLKFRKNTHWETTCYIEIGIQNLGWAEAVIRKLKIVMLNENEPMGLKYFKEVLAEEN